MIDLGYFLLTLLIASAGGFVGYRLKLPAGTMLGAMATVIAFNLITDRAFVPGDARVVLQILAGVVLGAGINKRDVFMLRHVIKPAAILITSMVFINLVFGYLMHRFGGLDLKTAFFATAPGGLTDMALIADEIGADMIQVSSLQLFRILFIFAILPFMFRRIVKKRNSRMEFNADSKRADTPSDLQYLGGYSDCPEDLSGREDHAKKDASPAGNTLIADQPANARKPKKGNADKKKAPLQNLPCLLMTLGTAACGGLLLWHLGVNAGALIGSMLAVAGLNVLTKYASCPSFLRICVQTAAGAFIGQNLNKDGLQSLLRLGIPMLIMIVLILTYTLLVSSMMSRFTRLDPITSLVASSPGGLQEMALIAEDLKGDPAQVIVLQMLRLMTVIAFFPTILIAVASFLS